MSCILLQYVWRSWVMSQLPATPSHAAGGFPLLQVLYGANVIVVDDLLDTRDWQTMSPVVQLQRQRQIGQVRTCGSIGGLLHSATLEDQGSHVRMHCSAGICSVQPDARADVRLRHALPCQPLGCPVLGVPLESTHQGTCIRVPCSIDANGWQLQTHSQRCCLTQMAAVRCPRPCLRVCVVQAKMANASRAVSRRAPRPSNLLDIDEESLDGVEDDTPTLTPHPQPADDQPAVAAAPLMPVQIPTMVTPEPATVET
jgi:hypothetical protein